VKGKLKRNAESYTIARLAEAAGVNVETVRYYQRLKLVPEPRKPLGGIRHYAEADAERLRFIRRAREMGFTLTEVASLLTLRKRPSCSTTREVAATNLRLVDARIRKLRKLRQELALLVAACDANKQDASCPVIRSLSS